MIIYKATNKINGKIYIGQTTKSLEWRKSAHISRANNGCDFYFHRALRKYGIENFKWHVICICPNIDSLNEQEEYYIALYHSRNKSVGYNLMSGGRNGLHSEETKEKLRQTNLGKTFSKEHKEKLRQAALNRQPVSAETIKKLKQINSGETHPMYGRHHTEESNDKNRKAHLGKKCSVQTIEKMRISHQNVSDETKAKMRQAHLGKKNPMYGVRLFGKNNGMYGKTHSAETKEKIRQSALKQWAKIKEGETT